MTDFEKVTVGHCKRRDVMDDVVTFYRRFVVCPARYITTYATASDIETPLISNATVEITGFPIHVRLHGAVSRSRYGS